MPSRQSSIEVPPLSQGELAGVRECLLEHLFTDAGAVLSVHPDSVTTREEYIQRITRGGFPLALARERRAARHRWFDDYVTLTPERDVRELSRLRQQSALPVLARLLAGQTGQVLNLEKAALTAGMEPRTAENHARLLEAVFLLRRIGLRTSTPGVRRPLPAGEDSAPTTSSHGRARRR